MDGGLKRVCCELIAKVDLCLGATVHDTTEIHLWPDEFIQMEKDPNRSLQSDVVYIRTNNDYTGLDPSLIPNTEFVVQRGLDLSKTFLEWSFSIKGHENYYVTWQKKDKKYSVSFQNRPIKAFDLPEDLNAALGVMDNISRCNIHLIYVLSLIYVVCKSSSSWKVENAYYDPNTYIFGAEFTSATTTLKIAAQLNSYVKHLGFELTKYEEKVVLFSSKDIPNSIKFNNFTEFEAFVRKH